MKKVFWFLACLLVLIVACQKDDDAIPEREPQLVLPEAYFDYANLNYPAHFQTSALNFFLGSNLANNPISDEGATLGRVLFYDKKLSKNNETACGSCHFQQHGFSDSTRFSTGFDGGLTRRNSMALANMIYTRRFFWDHRTNSLQQQVLQPIKDPLEMGSNMDSLLVELSQTDYYPRLFEAAFDSDTITKEGISNALGQFINSMTAYNSKYDEGLENEFANFTDQEKLGKEMFFERGLNCNQCHTNAVFASTLASNNGLIFDDNDLGQMEASNDEGDRFRFKVPTLRNIELTAPYMHDGRFETLEEVIEHYNSGLQAYPNLDERLTTNLELGGPPRQMNMTEEEKVALVTFLKTLTDNVLITDERFSDPFQ